MIFKDFIIKYTNINTQFIKDFSNIIQEDYFNRYNDFLIDSEILRKWLSITTHKEFKHTIKNSYKINIDYIIKKNNKNIGSGGHNKDIIILTPEAAKKICLLTKSKIGDDVRQYFIDIEVAFYKFKDHIIESLNKKIEQLENNQKHTSFRFIKNKTQQINLHFFNIFILSNNYIFKFFCVVKNNKKFIFLLFEMNGVNRLKVVPAIY